MVPDRVGHIVLKNPIPEAFFVAPQRKLRFSKTQLLSLRFKMLDITLTSAFMTEFGMKLILISSYSVVVKTSAY
jgi:hypothetical protein